MKPLYKSLQALVIPLTFLAPHLGLGSDVAHPPKAMSDLDHAFMEAAQANQIDLKLLRALCWTESNHRIPKLRAIDGKAIMPSYGICQIQMQTAQQMGYRGSAKTLRTNNHMNTYYAAKYLKKWLVKAKGNWQYAVSAYNRGHYKKSRRVWYVARIAIAIYENR